MREQSSSRGESHADVELSDGNVDAQSGVSGHGAGLVAGARGAADDEVGLETHAVDLCAVRLDQLDDSLGTGSLGTAVFDVVVVVVELDGGVDGCGGGEGNGDVSLADGLVPDALAVGSVLVEG